MIIIDLEQRSDAWHAWRAGIIGASEAPVIMGVSPWATPHKLWEMKMGMGEPISDNPAMFRGRMLEDQANAAWSKHTGEIASPVCVQHPTIDFIGASLDGASFDGELLLEIKCPGEKDHQGALDGQVPEKYWPQLQHQLACVPEAKVLHYWSYRPEADVPHALIEVQRDQGYIDQMIEAHVKFWEAVKTGTPLAGDAWLETERLYAAAVTEADLAKGVVDGLKKDLIKLIPAGDKKIEGQLVRASWTEKAGSIAYKDAYQRLVEALLDCSTLSKEVEEIVREASSPDALNAFRGKGSAYWTVTVK